MLNSMRLVQLPVLLFGLGIRLAAQQSCEKLADLKIPHTTITSAAALPDGSIPNSLPNAGALISVPARCVVKATARPTSDSEIKIEVWLPVTRWNGKYLQSGNGGWAGDIPTTALALSLQRGFVAAGTDDGHEGSHLTAKWSIGHPEKLIDFGYRALHETTVTARAVLEAFYGKPATRSYFAGCSDGGREALMEAQHFPEDFDGIISGAPANNWSHHSAGYVWNEIAMLNNSAAIPAAKLPIIQQAALAACDALDGVKDGLVEDPRMCKFNPEVLTCKAGEASDCLTAAQVSTLKKIYDGPVNPSTGKPIYPGFPPGTEAIPGGWIRWIVSNPPQGAGQFAFGNSFFGEAVLEDEHWDFRNMNFDTDVAHADEKVGAIINANSPDLRSFRAHGGKLIQYHGWGDAALSPINSVDYYERVGMFLAKFPDPRAHSSRDTQDFYRLFMVPGMTHCAGGIGATAFGQIPLPPGSDPEHDVVMALERWVEKGIAPEKIIASGRSVESTSKPMTRPLCPYPEVARYKGSGDANDAANFLCGARR
jgi:feruloyl esterase